ncbi:class I SAM-dependent methyltransferase [Streptomyces profundus]|uniref:class I SAM-dependent methyltransferase n=1 Tax=Streptomyces profundus TaxID=2867410 RepID=UPI001D16EB03|nr:class I SAM-dependent methyltransferase [Streptomyces sp. MA3_2.13]UED88027.1 class I SAM-dependent methyltransferase [Streptomyces sp. MA3_2.13]
MLDRREKWRGYWDDQAAGYDKGMRFWDRLLYAGQREWVCERAVGEVLEVAVGTGLNLPLYPEDVRLTGIDISDRMLELARIRADELRREVDLRKGDAHHLPFDDGSFDTVVCTLSMCAIPDVDRALGEIHRVLRPGGRLVMVDHVVSPNRVLRLVQGLIERFSIPSAGEHQRRRPIENVRATGFVVSETQRLKRGHVERLVAIR